MKNKLLFTALFSIATILSFGQEINLGDFEDGVLGPWGSFSAPFEIALNPAADGTNPSDSVVLFDQSGGAWNGFRHWSDNPLLLGGYSKITLDVLLNADGLVQIYMDNTLSSGAANHTAQVTGITGGVWTNIEFDVSDIAAQDYKQIAFQYSVADTIYFDNIVLHAAPVVNTITVAKETFGTVQYDTDNTRVQPEGWRNNADLGAATAFHYDWSEVTGFSIENGHWESGSDSSIRINGYAVAGARPWDNPSQGMGVLMATPGAYMGSWDTLVLMDVDITGVEDLKVGSGFGKRDFGTVVPEIRGLNIEVNIDDAGWTQLDTTLITNPLNAGGMVWIELPVENTGSSMDVRFATYRHQNYLDDITIMGTGPGGTNEFKVENVVVGSVDDADDFTCFLTMSYDADSVYMVFDITDDSIVNTGASYQCDNLEVYFDMDNSKNVKWPRNGGWIANPDPSYDANDWQLRLVPGVEFSVNNGSRPGGLISSVKQVYTETATGYQFNLHVALDSLMPGFNRNPGRWIGFDVLISDNDDAAAVNDANRNQITFVSPTDKPFNDPSLFSTLQLEGAGKFSLIADVEAPAAPGNLTGTANQSTAELAWDLAVDNIAIYYYSIYQGTTLLADSVLAGENGNTYDVVDLANGDYTFGVEAVDNSGNVSTRSTVDVTILIDALELTSSDVISVYPNPAFNQLHIRGAEGITRIDVVGITGAVVATFENTSDINISQLNSGIYIIKVSTETDVYTARFLKD